MSVNKQPTFHNILSFENEEIYLQVLLRMFSDNNISIIVIFLSYNDYGLSESNI